MEICRGSRKHPHDEIFYEGDCPCCVLLDEKAELELEIENLNDQIKKLNSEE